MNRRYRHLRDMSALALALIECEGERAHISEATQSLEPCDVNNEQIRAALTAAYHWGYERGVKDGFDRSFDQRPFSYSDPPRPLPSTAPRSIANGDERDDYRGGRVPEW